MTKCIFLQKHNINLKIAISDVAISDESAIFCFFESVIANGLHRAGVIFHTLKNVLTYYNCKILASVFEKYTQFRKIYILSNYKRI